MLHCSRWFALLACLPTALVALALFTGCAKKDPVTAANSGLRPAGAEEEDGGDEAETGDDKDPVDDGATKPPKTGGEDPADNDDDNPIDVGEKPPTIPPANGLYTVPKGEPAELVTYLEKLDKRLQQLVGQLSKQGQRLSPEAQEVIFSDLKQLMQSRMTAANRILASDKAEATARLRAVESKIDALGFMEQTGEKDARKKLEAFVTSLKDDKEPEIRRIALANALEAEIERISNGVQKDATTLIAQLTELLAGDAKELSFERFTTARSAAIALLQNEQVDAGVEVMNLIATAFSASAEPELIEAAKSMREQAQSIALQHALQQVQAGDEKALEKLLADSKAAVDGEDVQVQPLMMITQIADDLKTKHPEAAQELMALSSTGLQKLIAKENQEPAVLVMATRLAKIMDPPDTDAIAKANELVLARVQKDVTADDITGEKLEQLLSEVAMQAEFGGDVDLATKLYDTISAAAAKLDDAKSLESINKQIAAAQKRVGLIGKPLVVEGKLADGTPFDWQQYEGKVVLVDFWATWCGPCIREFPNIKENYDNYHDQGFEVVGVNLDDSPEEVESFFATRGELPWTTVFSPDDKARGFETPLAKSSGVTAIPFVVLVGKDGNVEAIHVRGEDLGQRLTAIFGEPKPRPETTEEPEENVVPEDPSDETPESDVPAGEPATGEGADVPDGEAAPE